MKKLNINDIVMHNGGNYVKRDGGKAFDDSKFIGMLFRVYRADDWGDNENEFIIYNCRNLSTGRHEDFRLSQLEILPIFKTELWKALS